MNAKCFVCLDIDNSNQVVSEFAKPDQRQFLLHELRSILGQVNRNDKASTAQIPSSNGVWHYRVSNKHLYMVLTSEEVGQRSSALFLNQMIAVVSKGNLKQPEGLKKLKYMVSDNMKVFNANKPNAVKNLNANVDQLSGMMRGNVNKLVNNVSELDEIEKKSQRLSEMSLTFRNTSNDLEKKLARKKLLLQIVGGILVFLAVAMILYVVL